MVKEAPKFPEIPETTHITRRQQLEAKQDTKGTGTRGRKPKNKKTAEEEAEPENAPVETAKPKRKARKTAAKSAPVKPAPAVAGEGPSLEPPQKKPKTVSEGDHAVPEGVREKFRVSLHPSPNERPEQRKRNPHMKTQAHPRLRKQVMFRRCFPRQRLHQRCEQRQQQSPLASRQRQRQPPSQRRKPVLVLRVRGVHKTGSLCLKPLCVMCLTCLIRLPWLQLLPTQIMAKIPMATWWILMACALMPSRRSCSACGLAVKLGL